MAIEAIEHWSGDRTKLV